MPAIIAIVAVVALAGAGAYFFTSTPDTTETAAEPAARTEVATNPETTIVDTPENGEPPEPDAEPDATPSATETETTTTEPESSASEPAATEPTPATEPAATGPVTYESDVSYTTPGGTSHDMTISLTLNEGVVVGADVTYDGGEGYSNNHQRRFDSEYETEVLGQSLNGISLARVGGASLTSEAFNDAVADIATQADEA